MRLVTIRKLNPMITSKQSLLGTSKSLQHTQFRDLLGLFSFKYLKGEKKSTWPCFCEKNCKCTAICKDIKKEDNLKAGQDEEQVNLMWEPATVAEIA